MSGCQQRRIHQCFHDKKTVSHHNSAIESFTVGMSACHQNCNTASVQITFPHLFKIRGPRPLTQTCNPCDTNGNIPQTCASWFRIDPQQTLQPRQILKAKSTESYCLEPTRKMCAEIANSSESDQHQAPIERIPICIAMLPIFTKRLRRVRGCYKRLFKLQTKIHSLAYRALIYLECLLKLQLAHKPNIILMFEKIQLTSLSACKARLKSSNLNKAEREEILFPIVIKPV